MQLPRVWERRLLVAVALLLPLHAGAQGGADPLDDPFGPSYDADELFDDGIHEPDWIPSLRLDLGILHHQGLAVLTTPGVDTDRDGIDDCGTPSPTNLNPECPGINTVSSRREIMTATDRTAVDGPVLGFSFELMGPPIEQIVGDMRLLAVVGYRDLLEGNTAVARAQVNNPQARGLRAKGKFLIDSMYYAGIGTSFQLPVEGYNLKLKPSINWVMMDAVVTPFLVQQVVTDASASGINNNFPR